MADIERILARLRRGPPEADFRDIEQVMAAHGWTRDRMRGSHAYFVKAGLRSISVPTVSGRRVKRVYVKQVLGLLDLED